jgi:hypothetical protein
MIYKLNKNWTIPCWEVKNNLFVIYWNKTSERKKDSVKFIEAKHNELFFGNYIKHKEYGIGKIVSRVYKVDAENYSFTIQTETSKHDVLLKDVEKQVDSFEYVKIPPTERLFIIKQSGYKLDSYHYRNFKFINHSVGDLNTIQEIVSLIAKEDSYLHLVESDAKWRARPASDKQIELLKKKLYPLPVIPSGIYSKHHGFDFEYEEQCNDGPPRCDYGIEDLEKLSMGDVSILLDQIALYTVVEDHIKNAENYQNISF